MSQISVEKVKNPSEELDQVFAIRKEVFVVEQDCPPELEWEFEEESTHFLARAAPAGTPSARAKK